MPSLEKTCPNYETADIAIFICDSHLHGNSTPCMYRICFESKNYCIVVQSHYNDHDDCNTKRKCAGKLILKRDSHYINEN